MAKEVIYKCPTEGCPNYNLEGTIEVDDDFSTDVFCVCGINIGKAK